MTCSICGDDSFRFCKVCSTSYCRAHECAHLRDVVANIVAEFGPATQDEIDAIEAEFVEDRSQKHWLADEVMLGGMSVEQLQEARRRYNAILLKIDIELHRRAAELPRPRAKRTGNRRTASHTSLADQYAARPMPTPSPSKAAAAALILEQAGLVPKGSGAKLMELIAKAKGKKT